MSVPYLYPILCDYPRGFHGTGKEDYEDRSLIMFSLKKSCRVSMWILDLTGPLFLGFTDCRDGRNSS